jgi:hypothetical protein
VILRAAVLLACGLSVGCRRGTPEERVRRTVAAAEKAAEEKDLRTLGRLLSERYIDKDQNDRAAVMGLLRLQLLARGSVHLLTRVSAVEFPERARARVSLLAAMTSLPLAGPAELAKTRADLYRFDLTLAEESGDWRVVSAAWTPARVEDFF